MGSGKFNTLLSVLSLLMAVGLLYGGYRLFRSLFPGSGVASDAVDNASEEIVKHSSDRMSNGDTYLQAASWLSSMLHRSILDIFKDVDEERVGAYMLTVGRSEFKQLEATYYQYRKGSTSFFENWSSGSHSLIGDLDRVFSSSEQLKYLSHLS